MATQVTFKINIDGNFRSVSVDAKEFSDAMGRIRTSADRAGNSVEGLGSAMKRYLSAAAVVASLKSVVSTIAAFERANSELASVLGTSTENIKSLTQAAQELGRTTEFTASEVTSLQTSLARLGFNNGEILDMQEPVLKFAAAVGTDLASAADFAGSALRAFGLKSSSTGELLDIMSKSTSASALSFSKLETAISIVGPVANAFGLKAAEVTSMLGVLSNAGFDASSAGTALRNILLNLADSNGKLAKGLGHTAKTMPEIISALKEITEKGVDLNSALEMTDKRSVAAFEALIAGASDVETLDIALKNATGTLDEMYGTMTDNLAGSFKALSSAWEGFILSMSNSKGVIKGITDMVTNSVNAVTDNISELGGGVSRKDKTEQGKLLGFYKAFAEENGVEAMRAQYAKDVDAAVKAYDDALDDYSDRVHRSMERKARMKAAGMKSLNLSDIYSQVMAIGQDTGEAKKTAGVEQGAADGDKYKDLTEDIAKYRKTLDNAVSANNALGGSADEVTFRLAAMKSGLSSLIAKYGDEVSAVRELISEYKDLSASRLMMDTPLEKVDAPDIQQGGLSSGIRDAVEEYRRNVGEAVKMNGIFGKSEDELDIRLSAMKDGLLDLISTFGLYNADIQKLIEEYKRLNALNVTGRKSTKDTNKVTSESVSIVSSLSSAVSAMSGLVGESSGSWLTWAATLMGSVAQVIPSIATLTAAINAKTVAETGDAVAGASSAVAAIPVVGPGMAVAASATILATILGAIASIPKFSSGGIAYGPTLGLFGEYSGAAANPEVVAPLDRLRTLIGEGTGTGGEVDFKISGDSLYGVLKRRENKYRRG